MSGPRIHRARFDELPPRVLYALLRLRAQVFVVEQRCAYQDLDGRDLEPATRHLWLAVEPAEPLAYLRVVEEAEGLRIGRVVTVVHARRGGLADRLLTAALGDAGGGRPVVLSAQTSAVGLYTRHGFVAAGEEYLEDGIPHVPMVRPATASGIVR
ncbi:GNAT family N-acetyltransferase [Parafrankia elaeagni]|uniref:GNAT family N-acetyltransferase n=1 Tax=Parafrankia elaeagni TaxID=222534 RepID=UPI00037BFCD9|nr:GNAT family N-acetyltransferase [Parafrankia elaeagni]